jgi:hypothetical protein
MQRMKFAPVMGMKTQVRVTEWPAIDRASWAKKRRLRGDLGRSEKFIHGMGGFRGSIGHEKWSRSTLLASD